MARTAYVQSVQAQNSTKRTHFFSPKPLKYLEILFNTLSYTILFAFNYFYLFTLDMKISPQQSHIYSLPMLHITCMLFINLEKLFLIYLI